MKESDYNEFKFIVLALSIAAILVFCLVLTFN